LAIGGFRKACAVFLMAVLAGTSAVESGHLPTAGKRLLGQDSAEKQVPPRISRRMRSSCRYPRTAGSKLTITVVLAWTVEQGRTHDADSHTRLTP
jgi:hypothetical protein